MPLTELVIPEWPAFALTASFGDCADRAVAGGSDFRLLLKGAEVTIWLSDAHKVGFWGLANQWLPRERTTAVHERVVAVDEPRPVPVWSRGTDGVVERDCQPVPIT